jgi:2-polyprenyl-3-methyl-5-hydroxy-6-metoxy-1,4-benzoquinol methylase
MTHRNCPICDSSESTLVMRNRLALPEGHPTPGEHDIVQCRCGFVFADVPGPQSAYDRYYRERSKYAHGDGAGDTERFRGLAEIAAGLVSKDDWVLDIGCARGGLLMAMHDAGFQRLYGMDPAEECVKACGRTGLIVAWQRSLPNLDLNLRFGLIILSHVLEHVWDLRGAVAAAKGLLADGGTLLVEVPHAFRYAHFLHSPFEEFNGCHLQHFTADTLTTLMENAGMPADNWGIRTFGKLPYPALWGAFKIGGKSTQWPAKATDWPTEYVQRSQAMLEIIQHGLDVDLRGMASCVVWGIGALAQRLLLLPPLRDKHKLLTDSSPAVQTDPTRTVPEHNVRSPEEIAAWLLSLRAIQHEAMPIVIGSLLAADEIERDIRALGIENPVVRLRTEG